MQQLQKVIMKCVVIELELLQVEMLAGKVQVLAILIIVFLAILCLWVLYKACSCIQVFFKDMPNLQQSAQKIRCRF